MVGDEPGMLFVPQLCQTVQFGPLDWMRIDCDVSLCDRARFHYAWMTGSGSQVQRDFSPDDIGAILTRNRFAGAIVSAQLDDPAETDWLLSLSSDRPELIRGVLGGPADAEQLDAWCAQPGFLGMARAPWTAARDLAARRLACTMDPASAVRALDAAPGLRVLVRATAALPSYDRAAFETWRKTMEPLEATGVPVVISGLINSAVPDTWRAETYRPWVQHLLERFGPARVMFGSDWPFCMRCGTWKEQLACFTQALGAQSMETREQILGNNAARWFGLRYTE